MFISKAGWVNLAGSAVIAGAMLCASGVLASGRQDPQARHGAIKGGAVQKGRETWRATPVEGSLDACAAGTASACRSVEAGMAAGQWVWKEGNVTAMDDWEAPVARQSGFPMKMEPPRAAAEARGNHIPSAVIVHRVLAACDAGDASACAAFASSVQPAPTARDARTYTAGR